MSSVRRNSKLSNFDDSCVIVNSDEDNMDENSMESENEMSEIIYISDEEDMASNNRNPERPRILDENNVAIRNEIPERSRIVNTENCAICMDSLRNACQNNSCMHIFCYECLQQWSMVSQPLT